MLKKSTPQQRESYSWFMSELCRYEIRDMAGVKVNKRDLFERLYLPETPNQVELQLIVHGSHPSYTLHERPGYNSAVVESTYIDDITTEVLHRRAMKIVRQHKFTPADVAIDVAITAMRSAIENVKEIETEIKQVVK